MPTLTLPPYDPEKDSWQTQDSASVGGDAAPSPARLTEDHTADAPPAEDLGLGQPVIDWTPNPYPGSEDKPLPVPHGNDVVRRFIESQISGQLDPKLEAAQHEDRVHRAIDAISSGFGAGGRNFGNAIVGGAQAMANSVAGKGYSSPLLGQTESPTPQPGGDSAVARYLAAKKAEQEGAKANLDNAKALMQLSKAEQGTDPDSLAERNLQLKNRALEHAIKRDETNAGLRDKSLDQGQERNDLAKLKRDDLEKFRAYQEKIGWARLNQQQKDEALKWYKANQQDKRIAQRQETLNRDAADRSISGEEGSFSKGEAKDLGQQKGNVSAAVNGLGRLKELRSELVLNGALPTDKEAEFESLYHSLSPVLNGAEFKTAWNKQHGENFKQQLRSPTDLKNWLNSDYFDKQADEVSQALQSNYKARVDAARKGPSIKPNQAAGVSTVPLTVVETRVTRDGRKLQKMSDGSIVEAK